MDQIPTNGYNIEYSDRISNQTVIYYRGINWILVVAEHKEDCWTKCGRRNRWSGKCSYCNLSNGSPGFCCHPDGRGSGCTANMIRAVRAARFGRNYQCVVPKEFDAVTSSQLKVMPQRDCWQKCGSIKGFAGQCDYCGPQGYCCNADGRGQCPGTMSTLLAAQGIRGNRCVVPATRMDDHRLETTERSRCKSLKFGSIWFIESSIWYTVYPSDSYVSENRNDPSQRYRNVELWIALFPVNNLSIANDQQTKLQFVSASSIQKNAPRIVFFISKLIVLRNARECIWKAWKEICDENNGPIYFAQRRN